MDFIVRTCTSGGHDVMGRSKVRDGVMIDLRGISSVQIFGDTKTAKVGGGILVRELTKSLGEAGFVTPTSAHPPIQWLIGATKANTSIAVR